MYSVSVKLGKKHPDPVVETASLSSVEPTDVWYKLSLPEETIQSGALSALQLEAVTYAAQQHEHYLPDGTRAGFLIGTCLLSLVHLIYYFNVSKDTFFHNYSIIFCSVD